MAINMRACADLCTAALLLLLPLLLQATHLIIGTMGVLDVPSEFESAEAVRMDFDFTQPTKWGEYWSKMQVCTHSMVGWGRRHSSRWKDCMLAVAGLARGVQGMWAGSCSQLSATARS
jgi:hypothetical protein